MRPAINICGPLLLLLLVSATLAQQQTRRVRVRARPVAAVQEEDDEPQAEARSAQGPVQVQYYAVQSAEDEPEPPRLVVVQQPRGRAQQPAVTNSATYNGLYGSQIAARGDEEEYRRPLSRASALQQAPRTKDARPPPVQTIRNFNTINDDGSFTFGYEAADGSFKEETRGTDCVVRGKYGYVDPEGNKREFTYVSGNPCDPNNPNEEEERDIEEEDDSGEENIPLQRPQRPLRPVQQSVRSRPTNVGPSTALFQNNFQNTPRAPTPTPKAIATPTPVTITPRPTLQRLVPLQTTPTEATTYRPQIQLYNSVVPTTRAQVLFSPTAAPVAPTPRRPTHVQPLRQQQHSDGINFDAELQKFRIENGVTPTPVPTTRVQPNYPQPQFLPTRPTAAVPTRTAIPQRPSNPYYSSQLVFDPANGQYNNALYQQLPKGQGDFSLNHRLQPFVYQSPHQPQQSVFLSPQSASPSPLPFAQQYSRPLAQREPQQFSRPLPEGAPINSFYYINPNQALHQRNTISNGQIDSFLRGHNIQF